MGGIENGDRQRLADIERRMTLLESQVVSRDLFEERTRGLIEDVAELKSEGKTNRNLLKSTLFSSLGSIAVAILLFFVLQGRG